jgi:hypothetical protein
MALDRFAYGKNTRSVWNLRIDCTTTKNLKERSDPAVTQRYITGKSIRNVGITLAPEEGNRSVFASRLGFLTTRGITGRMTVVQGLYSDFQIPAFLMEQRISLNPKLGHLPEVPDRIAFGAQLVGAIAKTVLDATAN